ncbi:MAG: hypothetical protein ACRDP6_48270 [Actinoallomurus sp.]
MAAIAPIPAITTVVTRRLVRESRGRKLWEIIMVMPSKQVLAANGMCGLADVPAVEPKL